VSVVDIIIPTKGKTDYLFKCLQSIIDNTTVPYHVHIADTGSTSEEYTDIVKFLTTKFRDKKNASLYKYTYYNFAKINNDVVKNHCTNDLLLFCNNDIQLIDSCIDSMVPVAMKDGNGTVGCRLLFENGNVQHAGQVAFTHRPEGWSEDYDRLEVTHRGLNTTNRYADEESVMGNTAALMMVTRETFYLVGGFNNQYNECFEDVEFNMEVCLAGYNNIYLDSVSAIHAESVSRTKSREAIERLLEDYNKNLVPYWANMSEYNQKILTNFSH
tara:strand:- start:1765 stop:2577 length:813 start_codon:yes stop_codon:yes gene_type:complete